MSSTNETGHVTRTPDAAIPKFSRVKRTATGVAVAGAADKGYATALRHGYAVDAEKGQEDISCKLMNGPGTHFAICSGTIAEGAEFEAAASGKIVVLSSGTALGVLEEAGVVNQIVEVTYY